MSNNNQPPIKSYNLKQLAAIYGEDTRIIKKWLEPLKEIIGKKTGQYYSPKQVTIIFEELGYPKDTDSSID